MRRGLWAGPLLAVALWGAAGWGATLHVGPGQAYANPCIAAANAQDGDTIEIDAGTYAGDFCAWTTNNLTIRAVGGRVHLDAAGYTISNGKAIWVIQGSNTTIEGIDFSGATVPDQNGAGIRQEGAGLTVRDCSFIDNDDGILAGDNAASDIVIEGSEFANNGYGDGQSHNFYINHVRSFTLRGCWSHQARIGHLAKSRALVSFILYNRLTDETGTASYEIDLPNGGTAYVIGNLIQQSATTDNSTIVTYGEEGLSNPDTHLYVVNNTFVNDRTAGGTFVRVATGATAVLTNNLFVGPGTVLQGPGTEQASVATDSPGLADRSGCDYHLVAGSPAVDVGVDPGSAGSVALGPVFQYVHPLGLEGRSVAGGVIDVGAYELGGAVPTDGGTVGDGGPADAGVRDAFPNDGGGHVADGGGADGGGRGGSDGCGCRAAGAAGPDVVACLALALVALRRASSTRRGARTRRRRARGT